jgi:hypothetical protein
MTTRDILRTAVSELVPPSRKRQPLSQAPEPPTEVWSLRQSIEVLRKHAGGEISPELAELLERCAKLEQER